MQQSSSGKINNPAINQADKEGATVARVRAAAGSYGQILAHLDEQDAFPLSFAADAHLSSLNRHLSDHTTLNIHVYLH